MALLREFTQGERPVRIELLSDPDEGKVGDWECARSCCASTPPPDQSAEAVPLSSPQLPDGQLRGLQHQRQPAHLLDSRQPRRPDGHLRGADPALRARE